MKFVNLLRKRKAPLCDHSKVQEARLLWLSIQDSRERQKFLEFFSRLRHMPDDLDAYYKNYQNYLRVNNCKPQDHMYNPRLLQLKLNETLEWCEEHVRACKKDKATSLEGFVKRHGEEKGREMFDKFSQTSVWSRAFIHQHGREAFVKKISLNNPRTLLYYTSRGATEEQARAKLLDYQIKNSGVFKDYYLLRAVPLDDIDFILDEIERRKAQATRESIVRQQEQDPVGFKYNRGKSWNKDYWISKYPDGEARFYKRTKQAVANGLDFYVRKYGPELGERMYDKRIAQFKLSVKSLKVLFNPDMVADYYNQVFRHTRRSLTLYGDRIGWRQKPVDSHVDHIFSIKEGLLANIDPKVVGHITNLQLLSAQENLRKNTRCDKSIESLFHDYSSFQKGSQ